MVERIAEMHKQPGICYAWMDEAPGGGLDCLELPVIDITHPAFAFAINDMQVNALVDGFVASLQRLASLPPAVIEGMLQKSLLMRGMMTGSANTYTTGMMTYLNKLPPELLGEGYATSIDRQWAAGLTPTTFRWRMRDVVRLLADGFGRALAARPGAPAHLINIGGGPAVDSLNALIVLQKEHPEWLAGRQITIHVLDLDLEGPRFGARALAALQADGGPLHSGPLHGVTASLEGIRYDWSDPAPLRGLLAGIEPGAAAAGSSEGGLFEYAADADIIANLQALCDATPPDFIMVGPVVRDQSTLDERLKISEYVPNRPSIRYLGLSHFQSLAARAGWRVERHLDGIMHQVVCLQK